MRKWSVFLLPKASDELSAMPLDIQAAFQRIVRLIETKGLHAIHEPYVKHLDGKLWEMRMKGQDGIARALYFTASGKRAIVLRVFAKKSQKTPAREFAIAKQRMKDWTDEQA